VLQNLNSFTLVWLMTAGGPVHSTDIWIVDIYVLAFQKINFGVASAYSVILFLVMMSFGWFYVRALSGDTKERKAA
jgi:multiple sugar transport system permease protein